MLYSEFTILAVGKNNNLISMNRYSAIVAYASTWCTVLLSILMVPLQSIQNKNKGGSTIMLSSFGLPGGIITLSAVAGLIYLIRKLVRKDNSKPIE
jgi:hypothetical protein